MLFWMVTAAVIILVFRHREIKQYADKKRTQMIQEDLESFRLDRDDLNENSSFKQLINSTFCSDNWQINTKRGKAVFNGRNQMGDMVGLKLYCSIIQDGTVIHQFSKIIPSIKDGAEIVINEGFADSLGMAEQLRMGFVPSRHKYSVVFDRIEFSVPESNKMFLDNELREAAGMPLIREKETPMSEYLRLSKSLPDAMIKYADQIAANIEKAGMSAGEDSIRSSKVEGFIDRYIPLINNVIRNYLQQGDNNRNDKELEDTLKVLLSGSEGLLDKTQSKDQLESEVSQDLIKTQLAMEGLIDPMSMISNNDDKAKYK